VAEGKTLLTKKPPQRGMHIAFHVNKGSYKPNRGRESGTKTGLGLWLPGIGMNKGAPQGHLGR